MTTKPQIEVRGRRGGIVRADRQGDRLVAAHVPEDVARQLRIVAAENLTTTKSLLIRAIELLFDELGKPLPPSLHNGQSHRAGS